jgi:hypothetical protein
VAILALVGSVDLVSGLSRVSRVSRASGLSEVSGVTTAKRAGSGRRLSGAPSTVAPWPRSVAHSSFQSA